MSQITSDHSADADQTSVEVSRRRFMQGDAHLAVMADGSIFDNGNAHPASQPWFGKGTLPCAPPDRKMLRFGPCQAPVMVKQGAVKRTLPQNPDGGFHGDSRGAYL